MPKKIDLTGQRFGRLTVKGPATNKGKKTRWICWCECGGILPITSTHLISGHTKSCGCLQRERTGTAATRHGGRKSRLYTIWEHMRQRCNNPNNKDFRYYGGRGIRITPEWDDFGAFQIWALANGYRDNLTLDRINVDGDYRPENCRWVTMAEQNRNKRPRKGVVL